jgi:hypothetical protein
MDGADHMATISESPAAASLLFELQVQQHHHDEAYHREIARLTVHHRLNHMALHFAKYAGKIAEAADADRMVPVFVDILIISLSTANILNEELWELMEPRSSAFPTLAEWATEWVQSAGIRMNDPSVVLTEAILPAGRMAAACEKIDHLEDVPYRAEIRTSVGRLAALSIAFLLSRGVNPASAVHARLNTVKKRLKLNGRILNHKKLTVNWQNII